MHTIVSLIALAVWLLPAAADADPVQGSAEADALFDQGRRLIEAGKLAEACSAFEASHKVSPATSTLFNLARCREQNQQLATAYGLFREVERTTRTATDERQKRTNRVAGERADQLAGHLSKLTVTVGDRLPDLRIRRGRTELDAATWGKPLPVDGGIVTILATAPGYHEWSTTIAIGNSGDSKTIVVPALVPVPRPALPTTAMPAVRPQPQSRAERAPILLATSALILLGGALALDLAARDQYELSAREIDDAKQLSLYEGAKAKRFAAQGIAVAGIGAAGVAVWLFLRKGEREPAPIARIGKLDLEPAVTTSQLGLQLTRRY